MIKRVVSIISFLSVILLFVFCISWTRADEKTYNKRLSINLYGKTLSEITKIKSDFEEVAEKYKLQVDVNNISQEEMDEREKWQKLLKVEKK